MSHHPHTTKRNCGGCGELLPPWAARDYCIDCGDSRSDAELSGSPYPRNGIEQDDFYEWSQFDDATVNEVVR